MLINKRFYDVTAFLQFIYFQSTFFVVFQLSTDFHHAGFWFSFLQILAFFIILLFQIKSLYTFQFNFIQSLIHLYFQYTFESTFKLFLIPKIFLVDIICYLMQPNNQVGKEELFVLADTKDFKLKVPLQKILGFAPMFNNTFVVLGIKTLRYETVAHYDAEGNVLKQHVFHDSNLFPYVVPSDREIIWVDNDRDLILQWNLETYELLEFPFKYNNDTADSHQVFIFPETRLISIAEWGRHDSNFVRFTYYKYPLTKESEPVYQYDSEEVWTYEYTIRRANTSSKFVWWKCCMKEFIEFRTFELVEKDGKYVGEYLEHKVKNEFKAANGICELSVGSVWQMIPKKYLIVSITDRPHTETEWPQALFVYEENNKLFREAKFQFEGKYKFQYVHYYSFGKTAMIRSFDFIKGEPQQTPVYYIDNENECIAARQTWKCTYKNKYSLPGFDQNMIIDAEYENGDVSEIKSRCVKVVDPKEIIVDMITQLIHGVDEELVQSTAEMLELKK